jgi:hypothetical protein
LWAGYGRRLEKSCQEQSRLARVNHIVQGFTLIIGIYLLCRSSNHLPSRYTSSFYTSCSMKFMNMNVSFHHIEFCDECFLAYLSNRKRFILEGNKLIQLETEMYKNNGCWSSLS